MCLACLLVCLLLGMHAPPYCPHFFAFLLYFEKIGVVSLFLEAAARVPISGCDVGTNSLTPPRRCSLRTSSGMFRGAGPKNANIAKDVRFTLKTLPVFGSEMQRDRLRNLIPVEARFLFLVG